MDNITNPFRIGIVPIEAVALMSYASTVEPLRGANSLSGRTLYDVKIIQVSKTPSSSAHGDIMANQIPMAEAPKFDLILVLGGSLAIDYVNVQLVNWLRKRSRQGTMIGGVSSGPLFLARHGLLDGHRMTVHWEHADRLQELVSDAIFESSLYVIDRDRMTCGGGTAPMDLMLALISNQHGQKLAQRVGDWFLHLSIRPSGDPQRASLSERFQTTNKAVLSAIEAMETHVANPLKLEELAVISGTSGRQLTRLFDTQLGMTPIAFGRKIRLEKARDLLRTTSLPISEMRNALMTKTPSSAQFLI